MESNVGLMYSLLEDIWPWWMYQSPINVNLQSLASSRLAQRCKNCRIQVHSVIQQPSSWVIRPWVSGNIQDIEGGEAENFMVGVVPR